MAKRKLRDLVLTIAGTTGALGGLLLGVAATPAHAATYAGTVATGGVLLNVRVGPTTKAARERTLKHKAKVAIVCQVPGEKIVGRVRTTNLWDRLPDGTYVSDAYIVRKATTLPRCVRPIGQVAPPATHPPAVGWVAPIPGIVGSGYRTKSRPEHDGIDIAAPKNTPIRAVFDGTVTTSECNASTNNCNVDGSVKIGGCGWYVEIEHPDKVVTRYCHMIKQPLVKVGQKVTSGQTIGYVGSSGNSSGPHLHFEVHTNAPPATRTNAVEPVAFLKTKGVKIT